MGQTQGPVEPRMKPKPSCVLDECPEAMHGKAEGVRRAVVDLHIHTPTTPPRALNVESPEWALYTQGTGAAERLTVQEVTSILLCVLKRDKHRTLCMKGGNERLCW